MHSKGRLKEGGRREGKEGEPYTSSTTSSQSDSTEPSLTRHSSDLGAPSVIHAIMETPHHKANHTGGGSIENLQNLDEVYLLLLLPSLTHYKRKTKGRRRRR